MSQYGFIRVDAKQLESVVGCADAVEDEARKLRMSPLAIWEIFVDLHEKGELVPNNRMVKTALRLLNLVCYAFILFIPSWKFVNDPLLSGESLSMRHVLLSVFWMLVGAGILLRISGLLSSKAMGRTFRGAALVFLTIYLGLIAYDLEPLAVVAPMQVLVFHLLVLSMTAGILHIYIEIAEQLYVGSREKREKAIDGAYRVLLARTGH